MGQKVEFDQAAYWSDRHRKYYGDPRSVGHLGRDRIENLKGEMELIQIVDFIASHWCDNSANVLDLGCGYGRVAGCFISKGCDYTGIDVSSEAIDQARERFPNANFQSHDLNSWEPKQTYDLVMALYIFVHFVDDQDWARIVDLAFGATKKTGSIIIADHFPANREKPASHVTHRLLADYDRFLAKYSLHWDDHFSDQLRSQFPDFNQASQFRCAKNASLDISHLDKAVSPLQ